MIVVLIDNGSLEAAAHRNLRTVAQALSERTGVHVHAVSWKHSDRVAQGELDDVPAWTLTPFIRSLVALGQRDFVFVPFFISAQGAIGSALRRELEALQRELGNFEVTFTSGLAASGIISAIVADRVRTLIAHQTLSRPAVVVVDHGGPSAASAALRDRLAIEIHTSLGNEVRAVAAASMEGVHPPLLSDRLNDPAFAGHPVVVAPLFLSPGRHAGPGGDVTRICDSSPIQCRLTGLIGDHPLAVDALADALRTTLSTLHVSSFA